MLRDCQLLPLRPTRPALPAPLQVPRSGLRLGLRHLLAGPAAAGAGRGSAAAGNRHQPAGGRSHARHAAGSRGESGGTAGMAGNHMLLLSVRLRDGRAMLRRTLGDRGQVRCKGLQLRCFSIHEWHGTPLTAVGAWHGHGMSMPWPLLPAHGMNGMAGAWQWACPSPAIAISMPCAWYAAHAMACQMHVALLARWHRACCAVHAMPCKCPCALCAAHAMPCPPFASHCPA